MNEKKDDLEGVLLTEATGDQVYEMLRQRYQSFVLIGEESKEDHEGDRLTKYYTHGPLISRKGLSSLLNDHLSFESQKIMVEGEMRMAMLHAMPQQCDSCENGIIINHECTTCGYRSDGEL